MTTLIAAAAVIAALFALGGCASWRAEKMSPPIGRFIDVDGARIHLVDLGAEQASEPTVVLIHGASVNLRDMKIALGDELAKSRRVIIVDRPGRGYSTRPEDGWRLARQAELIHAALESQGVRKPVIVGQSLGGAVALSYALKFQDEMSGLVLLAAVSHEWPGGVAWYNKASGWPVVGALLRRIVIPVYAPLAAKKGVIDSFQPDAAPPGYYEASGLTLLFRAQDFKSNAADLRNLKPQIIAMSGNYSAIKIPTAIVTGADDKTVSPKIHSAALARQIPHAYYEVIPDTGHALHHSETARIIAAIDQVAEKSRSSEMRRNAAE
ncbi:MAG: alpha/beta fold hydrolase [Pseudomonadota bacterium]